MILHIAPAVWFHFVDQIELELLLGLIKNFFILRIASVKEKLNIYGAGIGWTNDRHRNLFVPSPIPSGAITQLKMFFRAIDWSFLPMGDFVHKRHNAISVSNCPFQSVEFVTVQTTAKSFESDWR